MDEIEELLTRGVDKIYPSKEELEKVLRSGKKLTLYQGFDPTGIQMHIGHMVGIRKLAQFQKQGHKVIFLIGDGTGLAGDPSGKTRAREKFLSREELRKNARDYVKQAEKIVDFNGQNPIEIRYNGDWLTKLTLEDILDIAGHFSAQQMIERDMFQDRIKRQEPINLREFLYPLLQAYDSVAMRVDLELGGSDQTFNMLAGRQLIKDYLDKEKFVMTTPLLTDSVGKKIGKTEGNVIGMNDKPEDLFGKIMSLTDYIIIKGFEYLTDIPIKEINIIAQKLNQGENPLIYKKRLAFEIVKQLNSAQQAQQAQEVFEHTVQKKELPESIPIFTTNTLQSNATITDAVTFSGMVPSRSEAKRVIEQGGITYDGKTITDPNEIFIPKEGAIIQKGKHEFRKVKIKK